MSGTGSQPHYKKDQENGHGGAHGGSWKVAYADFVTAMMAFFLLLWLISMVSEDKRARVSEYFKNFNLFDKSGQSFMMDNQVLNPRSRLSIPRRQETRRQIRTAPTHRIFRRWAMMPAWDNGMENSCRRH